MRPDEKNVLISGGSGYIGSHLAARLLRDGYKIHLLLRPSSTFPYLGSALSKAQRWDVSGPENITEAVRSSRCATIFHLAADMECDTDEASVTRLIEANVSMGIHLARAANEAGCSHFVNTGSYWQYGSDGSEAANSLYAALKQAFQYVLAFYCRRGSLSATNLILHDVYGDGDRRNKILDLFLSAGLSRRPLDLSPGNQVLDFVHVKDVVEAYVTAWLQLRAKPVDHVETFHVRHERYRLVDVARLFEEAGLRIECHWGSLPYRNNQIMVPFAGPVLSGWAPQEKVAAWIQKQLDAQDGIHG